MVLYIGFDNDFFNSDTEITSNRRKKDLLDFVKIKKFGPPKNTINRQKAPQNWRKQVLYLIRDWCCWHTCDSAAQRLRQEDFPLQASTGNVDTLSRRKKRETTRRYHFTSTKMALIFFNGKHVLRAIGVLVFAWCWWDLAQALGQAGGQSLRQ